MTHRLLGEQRQGRVVVHINPPLAFNQRAAMAVIGVFAEADVGDHEQFGSDFLGKLNRALDQTVG